MAIVTYSNGIGTQWGKICKVDDRIPFVWYKDNFWVDNSADSYLMIGDLSV
ncbi:MAG: hypothetical protein QM654_05130 [Dysgonamonadaceae bacterium]